MRYSAFVSYNYRDRQWAKWLHRSLETYRIPKRLQGREGRFGPIGPRLPPAFRDRDELAASADLGRAVEEALREADSLIVICSPNGAKSKWVNEEIRFFTALGRRDRIRCLIVDGEPNSSDPERECLPPALFEDGGTEPLAADIRKHQDGKASARLKLIASILDLSYDELRQRDHARRQRRLALWAAAASVALVLTTGLAIFALISRADAIRQRDVARQRTLTAERTVDFVKSMFEVSDPSEARGREIKARDVIDRGVERIRTGLKDEPAVRAELAVTLGEVYGSLGLFQQSDRLLRWTLGIKHDQPEITARQLLALADSRFKLGDYEGAQPLYRRAIATVETAKAAREDLLPRMLIGLAETLTALGEGDEADRLARRALQLNRAQYGASHPEVARDLESLANNAFGRADYAAAQRLAEQALAIRLQTEGNMSPGASDDITMLGAIAKQRGDLATAERRFRSRLAIDERVLGANHPDMASTLNNLGRVLLERRAYSRAEPILERAMRINMLQRGEEHDDMAFVFSNLAIVKAALGKRAEAERLFDLALRPARAHQHPALGPILADLAALRCARRDTAGGLALLDEAAPITAEAYAGQAWRTAWVDNVRGECLVEGGRRAEGAALLRRSEPLIAERWPAGTHYGAIARGRLARLGGTA